MINLADNCILLEMPSGEIVPCSADAISVTLAGNTMQDFDEDTIRQAARAVFHYFKHDQGRWMISASEFSDALAQALRGLGLTVSATQAVVDEVSVVELDMEPMALEAGSDFELAFFPRLRQEMRKTLTPAPPKIMRFIGLKSCVKTLTGAKRWNADCRALSEQIVSYLRQCFATDCLTPECTLVVQ